MIRVFRICRKRHLTTALSGEGARIAGGRWNSPGRPAVYTASSLSLATLEILVHMEKEDFDHKRFVWFHLDLPENSTQQLPPSRLPPNWTSNLALPTLREIGNNWLDSSCSLALAVPSAVTPGEMNYLVNPRHPLVKSVKVGDPIPFQPDARLF